MEIRGLINLSNLRSADMVLLRFLRLFTGACLKELELNTVAGTLNAQINLRVLHGLCFKEKRVY